MRRRGSTLIELSIAIAASGILILAAGVVLVDSQAGYSNMYDRVNGDRPVGAIRAKAAFDRIARHASITDVSIADDELTLYSYEDPDTSSEPDRYAKLYLSQGKLLVEYGDVSGNGQGKAKGHTSTETVILAAGVTDVTFRVSGAAVQMVFVIEDKRGPLTVMTTAMRHNE